jgi:hypothetical protein
MNTLQFFLKCTHKPLPQAHLTIMNHDMESAKLEICLLEIDAHAYYYTFRL